MSFRLSSFLLLLLLRRPSDASGSLLQPQQRRIQQSAGEEGLSHGEDLQGRQLQFGQGSDGSLGGGGDGIMTMMPDVDWETILESPESIINNLSAWEGKEWTSDSWLDFLDSATAAGAPAASVCPIVELAIGVGESFGTAGGCTCAEDDGNDEGDGESTSSNFVKIQCGFEDVCLNEEGTMTDDDESATLCASVGLNFTVEQGSAAVNADVCMDFQDNLLKDVCFSYQLKVGSDSTAAQSCSATYGGKPCECQIEDGCILVDCSAYVPFLKIEECQQIEFDSPEDVISLIPQFDVFDDISNGEFVFESIDWESIDWNSIDWTSFSFDQVDWESMDWASLTWGSVFSSSSDTGDICPILTEEVLGMDEEMVNSCACSGDNASGFNVRCSFEDQGTAEQGVDDGAVAVARSGGGGRRVASTDELHGDVVLDFGFEDTVGSVKANLCVDFAEDIHPTTCIEYSIPIADLTSLPTCTATYGSQPCSCVIDENLCVTVDCSEYEETAVMDQCQILSIQETNTDVQPMLVPQFGVPSAAVTDVGEGTTNEQQVADDNSSGGSSPRALVVAMGTIVWLLFALTI